MFLIENHCNNDDNNCLRHGDNNNNMLRIIRISLVTIMMLFKKYTLINCLGNLSVGVVGLNALKHDVKQL